MNYRSLLKSVIAISSLVFASSSMAAGPLRMCNSGQPFVWPAGGANVPFNPDQGGLGILDNTQATQAVSDAFQAWQDVTTSSISYANAGSLPVDVDITNFGPFLNPTAPDGLSAIVFDDTGEIFDALFGVGSGVLGFASPEWFNPADCTILEGFSFLNGSAIGSLNGLLDLMVHEFGHYSNLAHSEVNGQLFIGVGDSSGPGLDNTFGNPAFPDGVEVIETMYPFLFGGIDQLARTPNADDRSSISQLYPEANFAATTGTITGTISLGNTKVTGVNVIARNIADPFGDAVSSISSDFALDFSQANPLTGVYKITGLTPGQDYAVYIDEILAGGFSTPLTTPLPGPEEFYNGANESSNAVTDIPNEFEAITAVAGSPVTGIDILFNLPLPGAPLPTGDDGSVEIPLPFQFCSAGQAYSSVFINGNGFLTLGAAATGLTFVVNADTFLAGPPMIAPYWRDFNPNTGGSVFYTQTADSFSVTWDSVPEFFNVGSNTFSVTLRDNSESCIRNEDDDDDDDRKGDDRDDEHDDDDENDIIMTYGAMTATNGLAGVSAGIYATSGFEVEIDLSVESENGEESLEMEDDAAIYELFSANDNDLVGTSLAFEEVGEEYEDQFERNNSIKKASKISLPFDSIDTEESFTSISPSAGDIDFFRFKRRLEAGTTFVAEVLTSQVDTVMALYQCDSGDANSKSKKCNPSSAVIVAANDDSNGLLSKITYVIQDSGTYALAVTFCCDYDFDGIDPGQGAPFDQGRYVLDVFVVDGVIIPLTDESFAEFDLGFSFPYQGQSYKSVFINSNGYMTFGAGERFQFRPNVADFENGLPRIAPLWVDLNPSDGGIIVAKSGTNAATISFSDVPEFFFGGANSFSVTLSDTGAISISYGSMTAPEGIAGIAEGGGAAANAVDLSITPTLPASDSTYEEFIFGISEFDLVGATVNFQP